MDKQKWGDNRNLRAAAQQLSTYNGTRLPQTDKISFTYQPNPKSPNSPCVTILFKKHKIKPKKLKVTVFLEEEKDDHREKNPEFLLVCSAEASNKLF